MNRKTAGRMDSSARSTMLATFINAAVKNAVFFAVTSAVEAASGRRSPPPVAPGLLPISLLCDQIASDGSGRNPVVQLERGFERNFWSL